MPIVDARGNPIKSTRQATMKAAMDSGLTIPDLAGHWVDADYLGPNASIPRHVRASIRSKARMERNQNSYLTGILQTLAHFIIGTGPRLQMQLTNDDDTPDVKLNLHVEQEWKKWCRHVQLAEKLRTAVIAKKTDGESFLAVVKANSRIRDLTGYGISVNLYESEQVEDDRLWEQKKDDGGAGIKYDTTGDPTFYPVKAQHPGENHTEPFERIRSIPASHMCHLFRRDRPGQRRGVSEVLSALPLFALMRRLTMATVTGMEKAANITGVLQTKAVIGEDGQEISSVSESDWMTELPVGRNSLLTLANGQEMKEFAANMPPTQYDVFVRSLIREISRCLSIPFNIAAGDSSEYNYSSGRLDHQSFFTANDVERAFIEAECLDKIFNRWFKIYAALHLGMDPDDVEGYHQPHSWMWDGIDHVDPDKATKGEERQLKYGGLSRGHLMQKHGLDIDVVDKLSAEQLGFPDVQSFRQAIAGYLYDSKNGPWSTERGKEDPPNTDGNASQSEGSNNNDNQQVED